jgi:hypothetical protein
MIPAFNPAGVLPPYIGADPTLPAHVLPYETSATELVGRLGTTPERNSILRGFLSYRSELRASGIVDGFQWLASARTEKIVNTRNVHLR